MAEKKSKESKPMPFPDGAFSNQANGSMDYTSKQEAMEKRDIKKLHNGSFKDGRYGN